MGLFDDLVPGRKAAEPPSSGLFDDLKPKKLERSWARTAGDLAVGVAQGTANLGGGLATLADTVTGGAVSEGVVKPLQRAISSATGGRGVDAGGLAGGLQATSEALDTAKSDVLRQRQQELSDTKGFLPSAAKVLTDPVLLSQFAAEQVPIIGTLGAGAASSATKAGTAALTRGATAEAAQAAGTAAATRALTVSQPVMSAGFAAQQATAQALQQPDEVWNANPEFVALVSELGGDRQAAKEQMARKAALMAAPVAAGTSLLASRLTAPLEAQIFTRALPATAGWKERAMQVGGGIAREAGQETIEEGGEQFAGNLGVQQAVNPKQSLMEGVPEAAGASAAAGGAIGGVMVGGGQFTRRAAQPPATDQQQRGIPPRVADPVASPAPAASQPPAGPLARAAEVAQATGAAPGPVVSDQQQNQPEAAPLQAPAVGASGQPSALQQHIDNAAQILHTASVAGKSVGIKTITKALGVDGDTAAAILQHYERAGVLSRLEKGKATRRVIADPLSGEVIDQAAADKAMTRVEKARKEKELEAAVRGEPVQDLAPVREPEAPQAAQPPSMFGTAAETQKMQERRAAALERARRPDPAAGPASAIAATAVDTGAAAITEAQKAAAEQEQAQQQAASAQQQAEKEAQRVAREQEKAAKAAQREQDRAVKQAAAQEKAAREAAARAPAPEAEIQTVVAADLEAGKVLDGMRMQALAKKLNVTPSRIDQMRMKLQRAKARGEALPVPAESPIMRRDDQADYGPDSRDVLDDDITTPSGRPFTILGAAENAAKRTPGGRVVEVDGGYVVRVAPATVKDSLTAQQAPTAPVTLQEAVEAPGAQPAATVQESETVAAPSPATGKESLQVAAEKPVEALAADVAGEQLDDKWTAFAPETGTLNVPRAQMPQIKSKHRGAMVQFLGARGITADQAEVPADSLKPTQAEFSAAKVKKALERGAEGEDRAILVSADGHVLDGHHQWLAKREAGAPVKVIRLNAPIAVLLAQVKEFPSAKTAAGAEPAPRAKHIEHADAVQAMADAEKHPGLKRSLAVLADAMRNATDERSLDKVAEATHPDNARLRAAFTQATGVALPKSVRASRVAVADWIHGLQKQAKPKQKESRREEEQPARPEQAPAPGQTAPAAEQEGQALLSEAASRWDAMAHEVREALVRASWSPFAGRSEIAKTAWGQLSEQRRARLAAEMQKQAPAAPNKPSRSLAGRKLMPRSDAIDEVRRALKTTRPEAKAIVDAIPSGDKPNVVQTADVLAAIEREQAAQAEATPTSPAATIRAEAAGVPPGLATTFNKMADAIEAKNAGVLGDILSYAENKRSRDLFTKATGVKLPRTVSGSQAAINEWLAGQKPSAATAPDATPAASAPAAAPAMRAPAKVIDNGDLRPGEFIVRDAGTGLARFELNAAGKPVRVKFFYESEQTRKHAREAIDSFVAERAKQATAPAAPKSEPQSGARVYPTKREAMRAAGDNATVSPFGNHTDPAQPWQVVEPAVKPSANTIFTEDAAAAARARLKSKFNRLGSLPLDPEMMLDGITLAGYHIERGARSFAAYAKAMIGDLGDVVRPYLKSWYSAVRMDPRAAGFDGMDSLAEVETAELPPVDATPDRAQDGQQQEPPAPPALDESRDSAAGEREASLDRALVEGQPAERVPDPAEQRSPAGEGQGDRPADDGSVRRGRGRARQRSDESRNVGNRRGSARAAQDEPAAGVERDSGAVPRSPDRGGVKREGTDYVPAPGSLAREGSWLQSAKRNLDIIELAIRIRDAGRPATSEEQALLAQYVGFGASEIRNKLFPVPHEAYRRSEPDRQVWPNMIPDKPWRDLAERIEKLPIEWQRTITRSTQYAHYTSEGVVSGIWKALQHLGFTGGRVFEPGFGKGTFPMLMPQSIRDTSLFTGIEMDSASALIGAQLQPQQNMLEGDYTKRKFPRDYFDVAIGNPPFARTVIESDPEYAKHRFSLHDYFFAKTIDRVRPGGLLVFVTSRYTMDKQKDRARQYLAARADLLGAVRLPQTAFKENAGTAVVTDVLVLRKRADGEAPGGAAWGGLAEVDTKDGKVQVNEYFAAHPEMVLGQQRLSGNRDDLGRRINGLRSDGEYVVVSYDEQAQLEERFNAAMLSLPANVYSAMALKPAQLRVETTKVDFDPKVKREGVVYLDADGSVMRVENGVGVPLDLAQRTEGGVKLSPADKAWLTGYVKLRDSVQVARHAQLTEGDWKAALKDLNDAYDAFRKTHGPINDFTLIERIVVDEDGTETTVTSRRFKNKRLLREDYDRSVVMALESITEDNEIVKAPFLRGRTIGAPQERKVETVGDALAVSLDELGRLDVADVASRLGISQEQAIEALGDQVYEVPGAGWAMADDYLSGDVRTKLEEAIEAARNDSRFQRNVKALEAAQPEKLGPTQIVAKLGASWIPENIANDFAAHIGAGRVTFLASTEGWQVAGGNMRSERRAGADFGTAQRSPSELLEAALNSRSITVKKRVGSGKDAKEVTDQEATEAASQMLKKIKDTFRSWVWADSERAAQLTEIYNERFNNIAPRRFDGAHLTLPGVSTRYQLHPHQKRAIWRQIASGNTYLAHAVGAGKTIEMIAGGMEQKRLGLIQKPMYVVPNHMLEQFANEFMELYPLANIMVADDENFTGDRRRGFVAQAAMNKPDAIVITHSAFERISVKPESAAPLKAEMLDQLYDELESAKRDKDQRVRRSQLEQQIEAVEQRFDKITGGAGKDSTLTFEDMGVDMLFVDEAHTYRKLDFPTEQKIKGIDPNGSRRALDMYVKTRVLESRRPGRSFVFASGTPVTNTMGELYTIQRFFQPDELARTGISQFDSWSRQFGETVATLEANAAGRYELVERFAKFDNVPELMSRIRTFMDVLTSDQLGAIVTRPDVEGGKPDLIVVDSTPELQAYMKGVLQPRLEISKAFKPKPGHPNPDPVINITSDGRFAALDPRFFGAELAPDAPTKLTRMADEVAKEYLATASNEYTNRDTGKVESTRGGTQIVFYNLGFGEQSQTNRGFNARKALTDGMVAGGVRREHILWFDDADTDAKKEAMFKAMRSGQARVLIGSAKKMGTGVNVQKRLTALHYFDPPWFPSDVEQPHGRIIRQGNQNKLVRIKWYATKGTYDSTMWQMVARKQRFIDQAFQGDKNLRRMEDLSEASLFEQAAALASGDPRALQLAGLRQDVERLERLQAAHANEQVAIRSSISDAEWKQKRNREHAAELEEAVKAMGGSGYYSFTTATVGGRTFDKQSDFGAALRTAINKAIGEFAKHPVVPAESLKPVPIASLAPGIDVVLIADAAVHIQESKAFAKLTGQYQVAIRPTESVTQAADGAFGELPETIDALGLARRVINLPNRIPQRLSYTKDQLRELEVELRRLTKKRGAPFEHAQELVDKFAELKQLEAELEAEAKADAARAKTAAATADFVADTNAEGTTPDGGEKASFAKSGAAPTPEADRQLLAAWRKMAADEGLFQFKRSAEKGLNALVKEVAPDIEVLHNDGDSGDVILNVPPVKPDGETVLAIIHVDQDKKQVYVDVEQLKEGKHRGAGIYAAALNYAFNNNMLFVPDPVGVKQAAMIRRTEHMLSAALKFGTTKHMLPHPDQNLDWRVGDDDHNLLALLEASADNVLGKVSDLRDADYDWDSGRFVDSVGGTLTGDDFRALALTPAAREAKAGPSTLRRALVQRSLARRAGTKEWAGVARSLLRLGRTGLRGLDLAGLAYGRGTPAARGLNAARLRGILKGTAARIKAQHGMELEVLDSAAELPQSIRDQDDYDDTVQAVITADRRKVYLIAARIPTVQKALELVAHELVGHYSMETMLGARLFRELQDAITRLHAAGKWPEVFAEVSKRYERNADGTFRALDDATFAAEAIAVFAERNIRTSILQRAINALRGFLRKLFPGLQLSEGELRQMLWEAGQFLEGRPYRPGVAARALGRKPEPATMADAVQRYAFGRHDEREPFYSALLRSIEEAKGAPKSANAAQWKGWLDGAQRRGEIKQSERDWVGVDAWLDSQQGPVTREALADFVHANRVDVQEVVLSDKPTGLTAAEKSELEGLASRLRDDPDSLSEAEYDRHEDLLEISRDPHARSDAKYASYRTPGGENYRELLLTLPANRKSDLRKQIFEKYRDRINDAYAAANEFGNAQSRIAAQRELEELRDQRDREAEAAGVGETEPYKSAHWDQPNVLAHVRFDEREVDGKRVLFVQEIQSDWHQAGRKRGYSGKRSEPKDYRIEPIGERFVIVFNNGTRIGTYRTREAAESAAGERATARRVTGDVVPDAPLKATDEWAMLAFKRMVRWAAEHGFDTVAWTTGEQAAEVFDLSKQVDAIGYRKNNDGTFTIATLPLSSTSRTDWTTVAASVQAAKVEDYVGKDIAKRILDGEGSVEGGRMVLRGPALKVGGAGMRGFYDKILLAAVGKWAKRFGAKVGEVQVQVGKAFETRTAAQAARDGGWFGRREIPKMGSVHAIDITPAMREAALQGQPLFAKAGTMVDRLQDLVNPKDTTLLQRLKDAWADWRAPALGALQLRHLGELAEDLLPSVAQYSGVVQRMQTMRNELQEDGHKIVDAGMAYQAKNPEEAKKLWRMLHDATLAGVDLALEEHQPLLMLSANYRDNVPVTAKAVKEFEKTMRRQALDSPGSAASYVNRIKEARRKLRQERKRAASYKAMRTKFLALSPEARALWVQMRDTYRDQSTEYEAALVARVQSLSFDEHRKAQSIARMRLEFESARVPFYVPLARWGEYWVAATSKDNKREFYMQESQADQRALMKQLEADGYTDIAHGVKLDTVKAQDGASATFMADVDKLLKESGATDKLRDAAFQLYLRSMPDLSIRTNFIHRQGTPGYSQDALRALAGHVFHGSFQIARLRYSHELEALRMDAEKEAKRMAGDNMEQSNAAGRIVNELKKRHEWIMNPQDNALTNKISSLGFVYYLGLTPAAALVNLLQTPMVALPVLSGIYKTADVAGELWKAMKQSLRTYGHMQKLLTGDELTAHQEFARRGVFDKTQAHNVAGISESDTHAYNPTWHKVMTTISHLFHKGEVVNREATAMAAYRLARADGASHSEAIELADQQTHEAHYDYSNANRARFMQSGTAKVLLMFRQYSLATTWLLARNFYQSMKGATPAVRREARRKLTGILGMTALFAGTLGLPVIGTIGAVLNAAAAAFGDDDDPWDWETEYRAFLRDHLGEKGAEAILRGPVQAATGVGISGRVSMSDLWFREPDRELEGRAWANYIFEQVAGPMGGLVTNFFRGQQLMSEGHVWRGVETIMPKAIKDGMKAVRYTTDGVNNLRGDPVVEDLNVFESLAQISGFSPASVANAYDVARDLKNYEQHILDRRQRLMDAFALAWRLEDVDGREHVLAQMRQFSARYPELAITGESIRRSLTQRARYSQQAQAGVVVDKRIRGRLQEQLGIGQ